MSEQNTEQAGQQFAIQRIYLKDASFEAPNAPAIFTEEWKPEVNIDLNTTVNKVEDGLFEVILNITATCSMSGKTVYLAEVHQAGVFTISGMADEQMGPMLHSFCPNILFPYAREEISSLVTKGSFPQLLLAPINFDALYAQHLQQQQAQGDEQPVH